MSVVFRLWTTSPYASKVNVEQGHWLFAIEDRRDQNGNGLAGMLRGVSLSGYLQLIDWSSRLIRPGKQNLSSTVPDILTRLQIDTAGWTATLEKLRNEKESGFFVLPGSVSLGRPRDQSSQRSE